MTYYKSPICLTWALLLVLRAAGQNSNDLKGQDVAYARSSAKESQMKESLAKNTSGALTSEAWTMPSHPDGPEAGAEPERDQSNHGLSEASTEKADSVERPQSPGPATSSSSPDNQTPGPAIDKPKNQTAPPSDQNAKSSPPPNEDPNFGLVIGVGSLVVNSGVTDYQNQSNVLRATNLGRATPQLLTGVSFRLRLPSLSARYRSRDLCPSGKDSVDPKANCAELWQKLPWNGFVSLKFAPGASEVLNGYVIGGSYSIHRYLNVLIGFALNPINEPAPNFRITASQVVQKQQAMGMDLNFDPVAMLHNTQNAFDGFPVTDPTGKLIYPGSPLTVHYRGGAIFGVSIPIYFKSSLHP